MLIIFSQNGKKKKKKKNLVANERKKNKKYQDTIIFLIDNYTCMMHPMCLEPTTSLYSLCLQGEEIPLELELIGSRRKNY